MLETILAIFGAGSATVGNISELRQFLKNNLKIEKLLTELVKVSFNQQLPRLNHLCKDGEPIFDEKLFVECITLEEPITDTKDKLVESIIPYIDKAICLPGNSITNQELHPILKSIAETSLRGLWKDISKYPALANQIQLQQNEKLLEKTFEISDSNFEIIKDIDRLKKDLKEFCDFANHSWKIIHEQLSDVAPPHKHKIDNKYLINPFLLSRAEDFNHNYEKIAKLFYVSPEWESIQRRTDNIFIEGVRGSGKSMILRRLTAQATLAFQRIQNKDVITYDEMDIDYYGVYIKFTRGYNENPSNVSPDISSLLSQHELNIQIFESFVESLIWCKKNRGLKILEDRDKEDSLIRELNKLFPKAPTVKTLQELQETVVTFEHDKIFDYTTGVLFGDGHYSGSAKFTSYFVKDLTKIFHNHIFPDRTIRLFILIDEFEVLLEVQQKAINTTLKMRLNELAFKIAVRKMGIKTFDTFTENEPIQYPNEYSHINLKYDISSKEFSELLKGISQKRLEESGYQNTSIIAYLNHYDIADELKNKKDLENELLLLWNEGNRRNDSMNEEFKTKYSLTALYRLLSKTGRRKSFHGFENYILLSSGNIKTYIELCKYAFYFALSDKLDLSAQPRIPNYTQTDAAFKVSQRLFDFIKSNIPGQGFEASQLLTDLGAILRSRLLHHSSEPEANRIGLVNFDFYSNTDNSLIVKIIKQCIEWSLFHIVDIGDSIRPKNMTKPKNLEIIINRIFCPALGISPRSRWRLEFALEDLAKLIDKDEREKTFKKLINFIGKQQNYNQFELPLGETENGH